MNLMYKKLILKISNLLSLFWLFIPSKVRKYFLIRVPLFERDWQIPLMRELGIEYFSDIDHKIEHSILEFKKEIKDSKLIIQEMKTLWGEIWVSCISG